MKSAFDGLIVRLHTAEKRISEPEDSLIETSKTEKQTKEQKNTGEKNPRTERSRTVGQL